ncbi:TrmH family RNA methyltransferase [Algihabitans sp.]|uniref:TrmH family RNA methyltransferase n=1 Tax=Algihabitans sp. TaxID=2821514 RepID=UPI003BAD5370
MEKIFGKHSVRAVFRQRPREVQRLVLAGKESYHGEFIAAAERRGLRPEFLAWPDFLRIGEFTEDDKHQGICAFVTPRRIYGDRDLDQLAEADSLLLLDQVSNPQNFATMLRTAAFFQIPAVAVLRNRSVDVSPTVVRYAVGGAEFVKIFRVTNLSQTLTSLKKLGFWAYGLDGEAPATLAQTSFAEKSIFVIGAEGEGLRPKTRKYCDALVRIPGGQPGLDSLNAGVAAAVAMAEFRRLRV